MAVSANSYRNSSKNRSSSWNPTCLKHQISTLTHFTVSLSESRTFLSIISISCKLHFIISKVSLPVKKVFLVGVNNPVL